ncbi:GPI ethanolamine phosphate transferase 1 [Phytophthora fragariae]|uniref:GPI ethanolamine phosphate transferase 1 n=2 Tax=Phytophthora fragariae TaxID=53985 RepID=A0A6A3WXD0_9STRA|nr:GPI ethanolamine phosphate transferase 1 [Phytophthora fragariae]KAE8932201.1 GPI ethanolamine phosphate transferase 1 [Phytophthora fragariae]KAE9075614.1 GPI ethanolamine phosphate transferase 1 [Phytophthora fragariae]KAE9077712.1 GPI ethanolamine phosphate transferase 1 [Phytophthora fragariae]KAE9096282.1 GPI ethanolamine phosphate transferase 1 [Phytophthora fragariae]
MTSRGGLTPLLVLGVAFHALYVLSIFDIYFTSPVVPHVESVAYTDAPPAKRVLVFVADGCRADKFFEAKNSHADARATPRASFLRDVIETRGSYGVSHTRVPTESRPGHVALFAGMYEDVSAVTKGWADNPVDFDSVFNQSSSAFLFGSPDIVPMFARQVSHAVEEHYSHEEEDFAKGDASELDVWVFRHLQRLLDRAQEDSKLFSQLHDEKVVVFCHYLGIDSNGHAHRPNSKDYLNNIALVDELVEKTYRMVEEFYGYDGRTAYVFTADHGMGLKGAHGDGDPANTRTPLVVWGAGVQGPTAVESGDEFDIDLPTQSRAQVRAQLQAQEEQEQAAVDEWGALNKLLRKDVMQADVAPLISALLGLPYPRNSVGVLPFSYLSKGAYRANAVRSNAQQLYLHALRKEQEKRSRTLLRFVPYGPFRDRVPELSKQLADAYDASLQSDEESEACAHVEELSQELIDICLATLEYVQRYDWFFLLSVVVLGYVGWIVVVGVAYLHPRDFSLKWLLGVGGKQLDMKVVIAVFAAFVYLALEGSPATYYLYVLFPLLFGVFTWNHADLIKHAWAGSSERQSKPSWKRWAQIALICVCLELVVFGYERREIFGVLFSLLAIWPYIGASAGDEEESVHVHTGGFPSPSRSWAISCLLISVFPYLPSEYGEHTALVNVGGLLTLLFTGAVVSVAGPGEQKSWMNTSFILNAVPLVLSLVTLHGTMQYLDGDRSKPPFSLTVANWLLAGVPIVVLLARLHHNTSSPTRGLETGAGRRDRHLLQAEVAHYVRRLIEVMLAFAPSFILLSIAYEVLFYVVLCGVLVSWLLLEAEASLASSSSTWREVQRAFVFLLLVNIAFFGTGNVASMSSFEISSTYRFVTVFAPFTMGALLVGKILIPFMLVACTFHLILLLPSASSSADSQKPRLPATRYFLLVVAMSDVLALHFLFLVKNEGSWKEIGNSISMFGIVNAQIVFIPLLFLLARAFVRDLTPSTDIGGQSLHDKKHQ